MSEKTVGDRIVEGLQHLADSLERGDDPRERFASRTVSLDLRPMECTPAAIRDVREGLGASQALFARLLGVSPAAIRSWEQGKTAPNGMGRRWLEEIRRDPTYWAARLRAAVVEEGGPKAERAPAKPA